MRSISLSLMAGTIGATMTATGTPAALSALMASRRRGGVAALGSILRAIARSSVVTEMATLASPRLAIRARISMSRMTSADLVTMPTGWPVRSSTSSTRAGDAVLALDRLVGVGDGAERDVLRHVARAG